MTLRVSKSKLVFLIILFFVFLTAGIYLLIQEKDSSISEEGKYGGLMEFCEVQEEGSERKIVCKGFVANETVNGQSKTCLDLFVLDLDRYEDAKIVFLEEFQVCEKRGIVSWSNPYDDYSRMVPVDLELNLKKNLFSKYSVKSVYLELMPDEENMEILRNHVGPIGLNVWIEEQVEEMRKGYLVLESPSKEGTNVLVINNTEIKDVYAEGEEIVIVLTSFLNLKELNYKIKTKDFRYSEVEEGAWEAEDFVPPESVTINLLNYEEFTFGGDVKVTIVSTLGVDELETSMESLSGASREGSYLEGDFEYIFIDKVINNDE